MIKSTLPAMRTIGAAAIAALLCVMCADNNATGGTDGFANAFNNEIKRKGEGGPEPVTTYTVTFDANYGDDGNGTAPGAQTVNVGSNITLPDGSELTKSGYSFGGWNTQNNGEGDNCGVGSQYTPTGNDTLYAKWVKTFTVTFHTNGGIGEPPATQTLNADSSITLPDQASMTRSGHRFEGWSIKNDGTGNKYNAGSKYTPTGNDTLYAAWNVSDSTFTDGRDGRTYKRVKIGNQTWMAENLNYSRTTSKCYDNVTDSCGKYGRLYDWSAAMNRASSSLSSPSERQGVCPDGWHLPSDAEWTTLTKFVGSGSIDSSGFSALSGGYGLSDGSFANAGFHGRWWSATESDADYAWCRGMISNGRNMDRYNHVKRNLFSVRCLQN